MDLRGSIKKKNFLVWELIKSNLRLLNYITESIYYITDEYLIKIDTFQVVIFFFKVQDCSYLCSLLCPTHTRPPCLGEGLLQDRWRTSKPISQLVLHWPQDDQGVHPPFLQKKRKKKTVSISESWQEVMGKSTYSQLGYRNTFFSAALPHLIRLMWRDGRERGQLW